MWVRYSKVSHILFEEFFTFLIVLSAYIQQDHGRTQILEYVVKLNGDGYRVRVRDEEEEKEGWEVPDCQIRTPKTTYAKSSVVSIQNGHSPG